MWGATLNVYDQFDATAKHVEDFDRYHLMKKQFSAH